MTLPAGNIWCPDCEESYHDSAGMCNVCGSELVTPPTREASDSIRVLPTVSEALGHSLLREYSSDLTVERGDAIDDGDAVERSIQGIRTANRDLRMTGTELMNVMNMLQEQIVQVQQAQSLLQSTIDFEQMQNLLTQASSQSGNPTDAGVLSELTRTHLANNSPFLREATLRMSDGTMIECTPAGFGGMGSAAGTPKISYRGDGQTFVQKARLAQASGYPSCVVINNVEQPWPFSMTDSRGEGGDITIPVVLVRQDLGQTLLSAPENITIKIEDHVEECCVCTESFGAGDTLLELHCNHHFHENCALTWLRQHNTCPYCRAQVDRSDPSPQATINNHETFYG